MHGVYNQLTGACFFFGIEKVGGLGWGGVGLGWVGWVGGLPASFSRLLFASIPTERLERAKRASACTCASCVWVGEARTVQTSSQAPCLGRWVGRWVGGWE